MTATIIRASAKQRITKRGRKKFFDELDAFFTELEKSGRKVMVVVVPEHGGALKGDRMQVSGLRDIPSPSITDVPVGVKFFGMKAPHQGLHCHRPTEQLPRPFRSGGSRSDGKIFTEDNADWKTHQWVTTNSTDAPRTQMQ